jgi:hypothetical protein
VKSKLKRGAGLCVRLFFISAKVVTLLCRGVLGAGQHVFQKAKVSIYWNKKCAL